MSRLGIINGTLACSFRMCCWKKAQKKDQQMSRSSEQEVCEAAVKTTQLYFEIGKNQWPIVYHSIYNISFLGLERLHPFDAGKWGKIHKFLKDDGMITDKTTVTPREASESDLRVVHTKNYLNSLRWSARVAMIMEVPPVAFLPNFIVNRKALKPFRFHTGGTILAAKLALERGWAINLGGGFHHCSANQGGGFCAYADITLALKFLFYQKLIKKALIVDLDAHQGNGHERDFTGDSRVYIFDMFNAMIYPHDEKAKAGISKSVPLPFGTSTNEYLRILKKKLPAAIDKAQPDYIFYNAGTDCLEGDPLGALDISPEGICERDQFVFEQARDRSLPIVMVTSGGYQRNNARIIADSILNLRKLGLIHGPEEHDSTLSQSRTQSSI